MMVSQSEFQAHIRTQERILNAGSTTSYCQRNDRTAWVIAGHIHGYSFGLVGESRAYQKLDGSLRQVFTDDAYSVTVGRSTANIDRVDGSCFSIPRGNKRFARAEEAKTLEAVQALYAELIGLLN